MGYVNYYIICFTILIGFAAFRAIAYQNKKSKRAMEEFWNREAKANSVRRADISNLDYITFDIDKLPINEATSLGFSDICAEIKGISNRKFLNLSDYTNTDLKMMYGPANLEALSEYDNNYNYLLRLLNKLSKELMNVNHPEYAKLVLETSIHLGSTLSSDFEMLGSIYYDANDYSSLKKLEATADNIESLSKSLILNKLNNIKTRDK
ncbi:MAG: hypothetical protein IJ141_08980 [Lachnospiraceae bacterium]|nr:hypothetical protein [Lachnospiraceae bacterium]